MPPVAFLLLATCLMLAYCKPLTSLSIDHSGTDKNFANGRRLFSGLKGKVFEDKATCNESLSRSSVPFVQIKRKSGAQFVCNGLLLSHQLVLTTADCINEITNTNKFSIAYRQTSGSLVQVDISWACKYPTSRGVKRRRREQNIGLITLDRAVPTSELTCFAGAKLNHRDKASLTVAKLDDAASVRKPLVVQHLHGPPIKCTASADRDNPALFCLKLDNENNRTTDKQKPSFDLCKPQASMLLSSQRDDIGERNTLGMLISAGTLNEDNCPTGSVTVKALNLTRLWLDGDLNVLVHHCSKSRRRRR